jgi:hypothetical protein
MQATAGSLAAREVARPVTRTMLHAGGGQAGHPYDAP